MGYDNTARARELAENIIPCFETGDGETPIHYDRSRICALIRQALDREHDLAIEECALHVETKLMRNRPFYRNYPPGCVAFERCEYRFGRF